MAKTIMFQGTGSHVGKSVLVAAMCRILYQDGYKVAPFKSQNMALNSFVTKDGGEMGRAQVVQAEAAGIDPTVDMNPILLKPTGQSSSQVIVLGKPVGNISARKYHQEWTKNAMDIVGQSFDNLRNNYEAVVIEGAGSPAEINLKDTEIVNMRIAKMAKSPVVIIGDIDKGGVLAQLVGTMELLEPDERALVKGFVINKFRGDVSLFQEAIDFLEEKTGVPVLGVVPYFRGFHIQEEDSIPEDIPEDEKNEEIPRLDIAVVRLPHISNFTDFDPLADEPDVRLRYVNKGQQLGNPDLIIVPGSKNTIEDLIFLKQHGYAANIIELAKNGTPVVGVCGGFQILGQELRDPLGTESSIPIVNGLGILNMVTTFEPEKVTSQVEARVTGKQSPLLQGVIDELVTGYEIHMGRSELLSGTEPAFCITSRSNEDVNYIDGAISENGKVFGTYIHGIFDNDKFRRNLLNYLRNEKGWGPLEEGVTLSVQEMRARDFDKLAQVVRSSLDIDKIYDIIGLGKE